MGEKRVAGRRRRWAFRLAEAILCTIAILAGLEISVRGLARFEVVDIALPTPGMFWRGDDPRFGVWHLPETFAEHATDCFSVVYRTNSVGARDRERSRESESPRVVVLGDSFVEGWGVLEEKRMSDLLERWSGIEHLNFGMSHFGPYQAFLVYRDLAKTFAHDGVLVGIVPINDFFDLDYAKARRAPSYEYRFGPYLVGRYPRYRRVDYRETDLQAFIRRNSYGFHALSLAWNRATGGDASQEESPLDPSRPIESRFYEFTEREYGLLRFSLESLVREAEGRPVAAVLMPAHRDLLRYHQSRDGGENPLARRLRELPGLEVVDLLPGMHRYTPNWNEYYFLPCDYHWSPFGHEVAGRIVAHRLRDSFYGSIPSAP